MDLKVIAMLQQDSVRMTPAELKALDGPTLRLLVAKHAGFKFKAGVPGECYMTVTTPDGLEQNHGNDIFWEIPDYCWSMTQAWQLVEDLKRCGIFLTVCTLANGYDCVARDSMLLSDDEFLERNAEVTICRWYCWIKQGM